MTYCVAMNLAEGLVMASDTRSNAGMDNISTFCKMHRFDIEGDRRITLLSAGSLATTQDLVNRLRLEVERTSKETLSSVPTMFEAAFLVGNTLREIMKNSPKVEGVDFSATFLLGGQIQGEGTRLFLIYPEGNFIEATQETPFFQIGESKYGKPIIDRVLTYETTLAQALTCTLISYDSTVKSNLSVGLPIDTLVQYKDRCLNNNNYERIEEGHEYLVKVRESWANGLSNVFNELPKPHWLK